MGFLASLFGLDGGRRRAYQLAALAAAHRPTRRRKGRKGLSGLGATGECKRVKARGRGCTQQLCHDGRGATGWSFQAGTKRCGSGVSGLGRVTRRRRSRR